MANLVDYMLDLYRNPDAAQAFIDDPDKALSDAGFPNVTAAQVQAVAAAVAPANVAMAGGDPVAALQQTVAEIHGADGGESLILPYFEADLDGTPEPTTLEAGPAPTDWKSTSEAAEGRYSVDFLPIEESGGPAPAESVEPVGGETVLLPYFEVDLEETPEPKLDPQPEPTELPVLAGDYAETAQEAEGRFGVGFDAIDAEPGGSEPTNIEPMPEPTGETVLLPYYEVDLGETPEPTLEPEPTSFEPEPEPTTPEPPPETDIGGIARVVY